MNRLTSFAGILCLLPLLFMCQTKDKNPFWNNGEAFFEVQDIFTEERFPNVVVAMDGSFIATWGSTKYQVRRSEDGGNSWEPVMTVTDPGFHGGGVIVDETSGAIIVFVDKEHPVRDPQKEMGPLKVFRSEDNGRTWKETEIQIYPDENGYVPAMHMSERGITLQHGKKKGRLIRPARVYGRRHPENKTNYLYNTAIYSDDGGFTWYSSNPFPAEGTGEGTLEELSSGLIYYNSRRAWAPKGENTRSRWTAISHDSGENWQDLKISSELPDGDQIRDYGLMGGLVRLPVEGYDILLFSNIDSYEGRNRGTVWASFDGGKSWPVKRLVEEGNFAYSSLAAGREGTPSEGLIYLLYESNVTNGEGAKMARFNLAWVTEERDWKKYLPQ